MNKLYKLKKWVPVADAARRLSAILDEQVTSADVYRLALDGHLKLSVHLVNGAFARPCVPVSADEVEWEEVPSLSGPGNLRMPVGGRIWSTGGGLMQLKKVVTALDSGVWDLPLTGGERVDVEHAYQQQVNGPEVTAVTLEGVLLRSENGALYELQSSREPVREAFKRPFYHVDNFHPAGALPDDSVFVVRTTALREFEQSLAETTQDLDGALTTKERNTLLKLVIGMAIKGYSHNPAAGKSLAPKEIADDLAELGISVTDDTVRKYLREAASTVLPRSVP